MAADAQHRADVPLPATAAGTRRLAVTVADPRTVADLHTAVDRTAVDMGGDGDIDIEIAPGLFPA